MKIKKFQVYTADLSPRFGTEPGKVRPVVVIQTDLLNNIHPSTIICPLTSKVIKEPAILRVHLNAGEAGLSSDSDILVDQIRAIDNRRFVKYLGELDQIHKGNLIKNLGILLLE